MVTVENAAPVITTASLDHDTIQECGVVTVSGSFTDAGLPDTHELAVNWGDERISDGDRDDLLVGGFGDDTLNGGSGDNTLVDRSWTHHSHKPAAKHWFNHSIVNICSSWVKDFVSHARSLAGREEVLDAVGSADTVNRRHHPFQVSILPRDFSDKNLMIFLILQVDSRHSWVLLFLKLGNTLSKNSGKSSLVKSIRSFHHNPLIFYKIIYSFTKFFWCFC